MNKKLVEYGNLSKTNTHLFKLDKESIKLLEQNKNNDLEQFILLLHFDTKGCLSNAEVIQEEDIISNYGLMLIMMGGIQPSNQGLALRYNNFYYNNMEYGIVFEEYRRQNQNIVIDESICIPISECVAIYGKDNTKERPLEIKEYSLLTAKQVCDIIKYGYFTEECGFKNTFEKDFSEQEFIENKKKIYSKLPEGFNKKAIELPLFIQGFDYKSMFDNEEKNPIKKVEDSMVDNKEKLNKKLLNPNQIINYGKLEKSNKKLFKVYKSFVEDLKKHYVPDLVPFFCFDKGGNCDDVNCFMKTKYVYYKSNRTFVDGFNHISGNYVCHQVFEDCNPNEKYYSIGTGFYDKNNHSRCITKDFSIPNYGRQALLKNSKCPGFTGPEILDLISSGYRIEKVKNNIQ